MASRMIAGIACLIVAVIFFLTDIPGNNVAPAITFIIIGVALIATSGKRLL